MAYTVYPDMKEKEKIFGGILTMGEVAWIAAGVILGSVIGFFLYKIIGWACIVFAIPFIALGVVFAFYKKYDMPFAKYLLLKYKFKKSHKEFPNRRQRKVFSVSPFLEEDDYSYDEELY